MKRFTLFSATLLLSVALYAQGEIDALNLSRNDLTGTARGMGMAGAFGALGGDVTGIAINPAGIGVYRSSEAVATMNFENIGSNAGVTDNKFKFNFDNVAYISHYPTGVNNVPRINFGFAYNRLKNFDRKYRSSGVGLPFSMTDYMSHVADKIPEGDLTMKHSADIWPFTDGGPWAAVLGYNGYLIDPQINSEGRLEGYHSILESNEKVDNSLYVSERGSIVSYDFSLGTNIAEIVSLGMAFSILDIDYAMSSSYSENFEIGGNFRLNNDIQTKGTGFDMKLGLILRPTDALRVGVAYHTPTWYSISDVYSARLNYQVDVNGDINTGRHSLDYRLNTPYKWVFSLAGIIDNWAVVSLDYEIKNYRSMNFALPTYESDYNDYYGVDNRNIDIHYKDASTLRAGFEFKVTPQFSLRGGFAWAQSPLDETFKNNTGNVDKEADVFTSGNILHHILPGDAFHYTFGFGYRFASNFYVDVASVVKLQEDDLYAYPRLSNNTGDFIASDPTTLKSKVFKGLVTLGYKF